MTLLTLLLWIVLFFFIEIIYFKIAKKYGIVDKPNSRSSHNYVTIRGGGIIFAIGGIIGLLAYTQLYFLTIGLVVISIVSFFDDLKNIPSLLRLFFQSLAVLLLIVPFINVFTIIFLILLVILVTGIINAYNFMDGINGITALYSGVVLLSLCWINYNYFILHPPLIYYILLLSLFVFSFFNLRKRALCFAGDVGSVSIAFIICFLILQFAITTNWPYWIFFLGIYGIDTVFTIVCRIFRREVLVQAHRSHFYQYLVNDQKWAHIQVSLLYAISQLILNLIVIYSYHNNSPWIAIGTLFVYFIIYSIFRFRLEGHKRLFVTYNPD